MLYSDIFMQRAKTIQKWFPFPNLKLQYQRVWRFAWPWRGEGYVICITIFRILRQQSSVEFDLNIVIGVANVRKSEAVSHCLWFWSPKARGSQDFWIISKLYIEMLLFYTIPVASVKAERSYSKLKVMKGYLRSSTGQDLFKHLSFNVFEFKATSKLD